MARLLHTYVPFESVRVAALAEIIQLPEVDSALLLHSH